MAVGEGIILNEQDLDVMRSHFRSESHKSLKTPAIAFLVENFIQILGIGFDGAIATLCFTALGWLITKFK
ncbi:hypothetical protein BCD64_18460 [Nostoc sp. MBR 210]|uniref:Uncharacterized protein n=1 Tax=Nostoc spongiaeforme FACHB-130 TaxID=1357510 RepID=A0ABR8G2K0_9NOSO|nr:hypothetical protein [Nostoc spongiaeforme]MBD2597417.1 hypothetical protein [Nostoc spongiaeforme FACHB-130]OCQ89924.1 hypothetical protein BCD64_18460 [Nostoc sp. MBR 210]